MLQTIDKTSSSTWSISMMYLFFFVPEIMIIYWPYIIHHYGTMEQLDILISSIIYSLFLLQESFFQDIDLLQNQGIVSC